MHVCASVFVYVQVLICEYVCVCKHVGQKPMSALFFEPGLSLGYG